MKRYGRYLNRRFTPFLSQNSYNNGNTYYVDNNGDDDNTGLSPDSAWKTIAKVSSFTFVPGDSVLFKGGQTFTDTILYLPPEVCGTKNNPITIGSYGSGRATLQPPSNQTAIYGYNNGGFIIRDLIITNNGYLNNTKDAINFYTEVAGDYRQESIILYNLDISGWGSWGVVFGGWNHYGSYKDFQIIDCDIHDNAQGIVSYAEYKFSNQDVVIRNCRVYDNKGKAGIVAGNGICIGGASGVLIEYCEAYGNGINNTLGAGPVGIWVYDTEYATIQYCESHHNGTNSGTDGCGFDFDQHTRYSIMQYNYSHDNEGCGYFLCHPATGDVSTDNIVRYNISENDGRENSFGGIFCLGRVRNTEIYNNTVYISDPASGTAYPVKIGLRPVGACESVHFRNNIFFMSVAGAYINIAADALAASSDLLFQNNLYYTEGSPSIIWGGDTYTSLEDWIDVTGQEKFNDIAVAIESNPLLTNPGSGGTIGDPYNLESLDAYILLEDSPAINTGLNLVTEFGLDIGERDYYGNSLGANAYDVGANEYS